MRGIFGTVALLVVLAIVGLTAARQLRGTSTAGASAGRPASSSVGETPQQTQQRVRDDVTKALEQGAAARRQEPDQ